MNLEIVRYEAGWQPVWDALVDESRNGHFMVRRGYLEYHADRFEDHSLLFLSEGKPVALLPAHRQGAELHSHRGLPFGGLIAHRRLVHALAATLFDTLRTWLPAQGFERLVYTPAPWRYHRAPFEDDLYLLQRLGARCTRMQLSSGFAAPTPPLMGKDVRKVLRKLDRRHPATFSECHDVAWFWGHLERFLAERHGAKPVHTAAEMELLRSRFPEQIRMFLCHLDGELAAGEVIYLTSEVQRGQYTFRFRQDPTSAGRRLNLWLADHPELRRPWVDFGTSTSPATGEVDLSLIASKEITGARGTIVQTWTWELA